VTLASGLSGDHTRSAERATMLDRAARTGEDAGTKESAVTGIPYSPEADACPRPRDIRGSAYMPKATWAGSASSSAYFRDNQLRSLWAALSSCFAVLR
jgi:hypothetical protein